MKSYIVVLTSVVWVRDFTSFSKVQQNYKAYDGVTVPIMPC